MRTCKTQAIVLHKRPLGEKDYAVTLFTPLYGIIRCSARGAKRVESKFTGHLDLLNVCDVQIYNSPKNSLITECQMDKCYSYFRKNLNKFYTSENIAKIIKNYTTENENNEDIYNLLIETYDALSIYDKETLIFEAFKIKFFDLIGNMPDVYSLDDTEFSHFDIRQKKLLNFLLSQPYSEIIRVYLDKKDTHSLKQMTTELFAQAT
jgi:DNA repair protein RecO (recombination protein O)